MQGPFSQKHVHITIRQITIKRNTTDIHGKQGLTQYYNVLALAPNYSYNRTASTYSVCCVRTYACTDTHVHTHARARALTRIHTDTHVHTCARARAHTH